MTEFVQDMASLESVRICVLDSPCSSFTHPAPGEKTGHKTNW